MIITKAMAKARPITHKDKWATPKQLFEKLNNEFGFTLDPCCEETTAKCKKYYTLETNGLDKDWTGEIVFVNPPYSAGNIDRWMEKCLRESCLSTVVALIPVSTSAKWWHNYIMGNCEIRLIKGRVKFEGAENYAPFSNAVVVFGRTGIKSFNQ